MTRSRTAYLRTRAGAPRSRSKARGAEAVRGAFERLSSRLRRADQRGRTQDLARPRILIVSRSAAHLSYFESVIAALEARGGDVELLFDEGWSTSWLAGERTRLDELREERPDLKIGWSVRRADMWRETLFAVRELRSYRSYLTRRETTTFYVERWRTYLTPAFAKRIEKRFWRAALKTGAADFVLRAIERLAPCDGRVVDLLKRKDPDILIVTPANMRFSEETDYLKAAKRLGIPTALPVLSWDNLSTKGLIQIAPEMVFVWNAAQFNDAVELHNIAPKKISIAGAPFFDKWFDDPREPITREAFCARVGFDARRKILLYLGSSANIARDETWFVEAVAKSLAESADPLLADAQILIRPHPANAKIYAPLTEKRYCVWPRDGALPETQEQFSFMRETFQHADAALGVNTSGMVDAVLADLPSFTVLLPRYADTQANSRHFRQLVEAGAICLAPDIPGLCGALSNLFAGADPLAKQRRAFAEAFARPCGAARPAGDVIAEAVIRRARERRNG